MEQKFPATTIRVYPIRNDFFGEQITVSGLDYRAGSAPSAERQGAWETSFCFPAICSEAERKYCLDDVTLSQVKDALQVDDRYCKIKRTRFYRRSFNSS